MDITNCIYNEDGLAQTQKKPLIGGFFIFQIYELLAIGYELFIILLLSL